MRDESNAVIAFTLALKFAFIVTCTRWQLNFSLVELRSFSRASLRHQKIIRSCLDVLPGNVLRFDNVYRLGCRS